MEITKTFYTPHRHEWRKWLQNNFDKEKEIWLVFPNQSSGKERLPYNDAVEEALCFGWIDSTVKSLEAGIAAQRFTPRNPKSSYSQPNKERLRWLNQHDLLHPKVKETVKHLLEETFIIPADILQIIENDRVIKENFDTFSESYKRIRVAYIDGARERPEEFTKRLNNFLETTRKNKLIKGAGGIEKYY